MNASGVDDAQERILNAGRCGAPVSDIPWPTFCARAAHHRHPCMAVSETCVWCFGRVTPDGHGSMTAVRPDGKWIHLTCVYERDAQKIATGDITPSVEDGEKWCPACQLVRPIEEFSKNRARPDGLQGYCRWCHRDQVAARKRERQAS